MHRKSCLYRWGVGISKSRDGYLFVRILKLYAERCTMNKITVIGSGSVDSTIAYTLTVMGLAHEIVMIDINGDKALGEAIDIRQGGLFCEGRYILCGLHVRMSYLRMSSLRYRYHDDRFHHAAWRIRCGRCLPQPRKCYRQKGCTYKGHTASYRE